MDEFSLIDKYFKNINFAKSDIKTPIGDDCAVYKIKKNTVITTDSFIENVHFKKDNHSAFEIGHMALCAALSDLSAMGAKPKYILLNLCLLKDEQVLLTGISQAIKNICQKFSLSLIGGNTSFAPFALHFTCIGYANKTLNRNMAKENDDIYVSGEIGAKSYQTFQELKKTKSMDFIRGFFAKKRQNFFPRIKLSLALKKHIKCAIDISDGLLADLTHVLLASKKSASIDFLKIPVADELVDIFGEDEAKQIALSCGEDYELIFCASKNKQKTIACIAKKLEIRLTKIGEVTQSELGKINLLKDNHQLKFNRLGFNHFEKK